jgi:hypothetical protein
MSHRLRCPAAYPPKFKSIFRLPYFDYHCNSKSAEMAAPNAICGATCVVHCNLPAIVRISRNCAGRYRSLLSLKAQILIFSTCNHRRNLANNIGEGRGGAKATRGLRNFRFMKEPRYTDGERSFEPLLNIGPPISSTPTPNAHIFDWPNYSLGSKKYWRGICSPIYTYVIYYLYLFPMHVVTIILLLHQRMHINWKHYHYLYIKHNVKSMWHVLHQ